MSNDANQKETGSQEFKLAVIGIGGSGKTTLAVGLYGRSHERQDYCEVQDNARVILDGLCTKLKEGTGPVRTNKQQQMKMLYHHSEEDQCVLDFFDYLGEESTNKDRLAGLINRVGGVGVVILVNPKHFLKEDNKEKNEKLIHNVKEILDSAKDIKHVALVMTAHDWFVDHKEKQDEIQKWFDGLHDELKGAERDVRDFQVTVYGYASNGKPSLSDDNNAYEPFKWIVDRVLAKKHIGMIIDAGNGAKPNGDILIKIGKRARKWKYFALAAIFVVCVLGGVWFCCNRKTKVEVEQREQHYEKDKEENTNKIAQLERDVNKLEVARNNAKAEVADSMAKAECAECLRSMTEKLHSRYGVDGVVDCFNAFCSEHPEAVNTTHAEEVVQFLHEKIGGEFMRIYADITNQMWQVATNQVSQIASRDLDASFNSLKEITAKVCTIKHPRAKKSNWYEFAEKCKKGLTSRDEAFALEYEVTKIEVMMDYGEVSKYFRKLKLDTPSPVMLVASTNESKVVMWKKIQDPLELGKNAGRIETNKVWQTVWEGSFQAHGNPWRDAGVRMTIKDMRTVFTSAKKDFVIPLYGDGGGQNGDGGVRVVEKRMLMPLKESSKSKDPYVRIRVHVKDSPCNDSAGNLFSLMPKDAKQERP